MIAVMAAVFSAAEPVPCRCRRRDGKGAATCRYLPPTRKWNICRLSQQSGRRRKSRSRPIGGRPETVGWKAMPRLAAGCRRSPAKTGRVPPRNSTGDGTETIRHRGRASPGRKPPTVPPAAAADGSRMGLGSAVSGSSSGGSHCSVSGARRPDERFDRVQRLSGGRFGLPTWLNRSRCRKNMASGTTLPEIMRG